MINTMDYEHKEQDIQRGFACERVITAALFFPLLATTTYYKRSAVEGHVLKKEALNQATWRKGEGE